MLTTEEMEYDIYDIVKTKYIALFETVNSWKGAIGCLINGENIPFRELLIQDQEYVYQQIKKNQ